MLSNMGGTNVHTKHIKVVKTKDSIIRCIVMNMFIKTVEVCKVLMEN